MQSYLRALAEERGLEVLVLNVSNEVGDLKTRKDLD